MDEELIRMTPDAKRALMSRIGALKTDRIYRVKVTEVRKRLTRDQQGFWFAAVVKPFAELMMDHDEELSEKAAMEAAHKRLKEEFLSRAVFDESGEVIADVTPSLSDLDVAQTSKLIDQSINWLAMKWGIIVVTPEEFYGINNERRDRRSALKGDRQ